MKTLTDSIARTVEFEADCTRYVVQVTPGPTPSSIIVALVNFGLCAQVGRHPYYEYLAEKLRISHVDAQNIITHALDVLDPDPNNTDADEEYDAMGNRNDA